MNKSVKVLIFGFFTGFESHENFELYGMTQSVVMTLLHVEVFLLQHRYYKRDDAKRAMCFINRTKLDDRIVRTDWDAGFVEGRQFGRGRTGGQVSSTICDGLHFEAIVCLFRLEMNTELIMMRDVEGIVRVQYVCLRGLAILSIRSHGTDLHCNHTINT